MRSEDIKDINIRKAQWPRCQPANWVTGYGTSTSAALGATTGTGWLALPELGNTPTLPSFIIQSVQMSRLLLLSGMMFSNRNCVDGKSCSIRRSKTYLRSLHFRWLLDWCKNYDEWRKQPKLHTWICSFVVYNNNKSINVFVISTGIMYSVKFHIDSILPSR